MSCLDNPANSDILEWLPDSDGFLIKDKKLFRTEILPQVLKQTQYSSFTRRMNRWQFKLNNLSHKQASYHHPLFRRGRQDLAMQMAPIRQKQYGSGGDRNSSNSRNQSKSFSANTTTNGTKTENQVQISIQMPNNSSSDDEDEFMTDKGDRKYTMDRKSAVEGWKMKSKSQSSSLAAAACHTNHGDKTSYHYSTQSNNLASYDTSLQYTIHPPSTQEMETPYNHNILNHMNAQHFMNHMQIQPTSGLPTSQSMPYHVHQSFHKENFHHQWFPHVERHHQKQQQSFPWMQKQDPIMLDVSKPSHPNKDHISFTHAPSTTSIPSMIQISSENSQELIEYHQKLTDYLSQYQRSNDLEISKRAIEHLKKIQQI